MQNTRFKLIGAVTTKQAEVLKTLYELEAQIADRRYWKTKDLGGYRSSHHSLTLRRLWELGLVEREDSGHSFGYRIAQAGQTLWRVICAASTLPQAAIFGGARVAPRVQALTELVA